MVCLASGKAGGVLQGFIADDYGEQHLAQIAILIVPGIERNIFSARTAAIKPLGEENDNLYSFKPNLSADEYARNELAMDAVANAQVWHRRLGHLNKRSLELLNRENGNGVAFDGSIADCNVCAVGKRSHQLPHPKKAKHAAINAPFQIVYGNLVDSFEPTTHHGGHKVVSKITNQGSPSGPQSTFWAAKIKTLPRFSCSLQP